MSRNWLITGGCGFIGLNLIKRLLETPENHIRVIDNLSYGTRKDLEQVCSFTELSASTLSFKDGGHVQPGVYLVQGDIRDAELALRLARGVNVIVHLAANSGVPLSIAEPRLDCDCNVLGTFNYLEAARQAQCDSFVFASSSAVVGNAPPPMHEELPAHPIAPYGASKLAGEAYCSAYYHSYGVNTVALRFGNVYGPFSFNKKSLIARSVRRALAGKSIEIFGDGSITRDFIYSEDIVDAILKSATTPSVGGEVFQIATNQERTVSEAVETLIDVLSREGIHCAIQYLGDRFGDIKRNYSDTTKAGNILNWKSKTVFSDGLRNTIESFDNFNK